MQFKVIQQVLWGQLDQNEVWLCNTQRFIQILSREVRVLEVGTEEDHAWLTCLARQLPQLNIRDIAAFTLLQHLFIHSSIQLKLSFWLRCKFVFFTLFFLCQQVLCCLCYVEPCPLRYFGV